MSAEEYTRIRQMKVTEIGTLDEGVLARFIEASSRVQRQMLLQLLRH